MENRVRVFRQQKGLTQMFLSHESGVPQPTISQIEEGSREPTVTTAILLARALDTTVEVLFPIPD